MTLDNTTYTLREGAGIGPCMDVKAHNGLLYAIQKKNDVHGGRLCVLTPDMQLVACYDGIGMGRQSQMCGVGRISD